MIIPDPPSLLEDIVVTKPRRRVSPFALGLVAAGLLGLAIILLVSHGL